MAIALTERKYTREEIAKWMGVSPRTLSNNFGARIERLKDFCDFEVSGKIINVIKVHKPYYEKGRNAFDDKVYDNFVKTEVDNGITTITWMSKKLCGAGSAYQGGKPRVIANRLSKAAVRQYGKTNSTEPGKVGFRKYIWAI